MSLSVLAAVIEFNSHQNIAELLSLQPRNDGKAKPYQLRQFLKLVEAYNLELDED